MISRILLAVEGSQHALRATEMAAELAEKLNAELGIVHVLMHGRPPAELVHMAEVEHLVEQAQAVVSPEARYVPGSQFQMLKDMTAAGKSARVVSALGDQIVKQAKARCIELGVRKVATSVRVGDYADEILDAAQDQSADMIIVGSRGLGTLKSAVLGSVSQKVLHHANCAVLTVR